MATRISNFKFSTKLVVLLYFAGPILFTLTAIFGGDPLDGFAGGPTTNSDADNSMFGLSLRLLVIGPLLATMLAAYCWYKYSKKEKRFLPLVVTTLAFSVPPLLICVLFIATTPHR